MSNSRSVCVPHLHPHPLNSTPSTHNLQTSKTRIVSVHQKIQENAKGPHVYHMIIFLALAFPAMLLLRKCPSDFLFWKFVMPQKFSNKNWGFSQKVLAASQIEKNMFIQRVETLACSWVHCWLSTPFETKI